MSDQGTEEKDLGAQDSTVSAGSKPTDTRIAPGVTEQNQTESEADAASSVQLKKRQLASRTVGVIAACAIALVAVFAGVGYATGLFGSAQPSDQIAQQQEQSATGASVKSSKAQQGSSDRADSSNSSADKASSTDGEKAKDENSSTDSSDKGSNGSASDQASQSGSSSDAADSNAAESSDATSSGSAASSSSEPAYQEPAPAPAPSTISVYISIDSSRAQSYGLGGFSYGATVELPQGATVYDALCATGASISGSSYYVSAINGLAEKQCGSGSGWTYAVNGSFPGKACGRYTLSGGESIAWIYSTEKDPTMAM